MLESDDIRRLLCSRVAIGFGRAPHEITIPATGDDKSSVDDFAIGRGIVSMRVGLPYDLLRLSPRPSICIRKLTQTQTRHGKTCLGLTPPNTYPSTHPTYPPSPNQTKQQTHNQILSTSYSQYTSASRYEHRKQQVLMLTSPWSAPTMSGHTYLSHTQPRL